MADTREKPVGIPIGANGGLIRGRIIVNKNGDAEWYQPGASFPTFTSNKSNNYQWQPSPNCFNPLFGSGTCPTNEERQRFYSNTSSTTTLNNARLNTFNSSTEFNSPQLAKQLNIPGANTAPSGTNPQPQPPNQGGNPPVNPPVQTSDGPSSIPVQIPTSDNPAEPVSSGGALIYPINMGKTNQDRIKFTAVKYRASGNLETGQLSLPNRKLIKESNGSVFLPVQASITDANSVDWQGAGLNLFERSVANLSGGLMTAQTYDEGAAQLGQFGKIYTDAMKKYGNEARAYLAGEAASIQNLLGRFGSVLNPNLELLFTGPQLRPFEFRFQMSAREEGEAVVIKQIINYFKRNMAVKKTDDGTFLKAPNTFFIEYQKGNSEHKSINKIKECALTNCSVDYTPLGTYMTFNDAEATMVSYAMTLSFQELEPIYADDYGDHPIGY